MAKTQNLSLNPTKISGTCGRLMCCLKYEQDAYEDLIRTSPKAESFVDTPDGRGTVVEIDLLRQRVKVKMEEHPETITSYANTDIAVLRNGKAKKNDPPIPADLAPISGSNKRRRKVEEQPEEGRMFLDPIKFRYSTETIVEEPVEEIIEEVQEEAPKAQRSRRRNRKPAKVKPAEEEKKPAQAEKKPAEKPKQPKPQPEKKTQSEKKAQKAAPAEPKAEKPDAAEAPKKTNKRRRPHYRHHKPKASGGAKE